MKKLIYLVIFLIATVSIAQSKGTLTGQVQDKAIDLEPVAFATIYVKGKPTIGTTSDFDGNYTLALDEGTYTIVYEFLGYSTVNREVIVKSGDIIKMNIVMQPQAEALTTVQLKVIKKQNTEKAMLKTQKEATVTLDAISAEAIKKTGATNVASAVKSVTGVSVEGGKYVVVRGLNDRYTKTLLNGVQVPGLDPDKNAVQLDIFPTGIIDNISVIKSGSAEYPADFTGGVVDIITKTVTGKRVGNVNAGLGYNPSMHFNDKFLTYKGSSTDFLGFDNGDRDYPIVRNTNVPSRSANNAELRALTNSFNSELKAKRATSLLNYNFGTTYGNSVEIGTAKLGYLGSVAYRFNTTLFEDALDQNFIRDPSANGVLLEFETGRSRGNIAVENTTLTLFGGLFLDTNNSNYKFKVLHILNGESTAGFYDQEYYANPGDFETDFVTNALLYTERSFTNLLLSGKHTKEDATWELDWKVSPTFSRSDDLNHRITPFSVNEDRTNYVIQVDIGGNPLQLWRFLEEVNIDNKLDFVNGHTLFGEDAKLKLGGAFAWKQRDFSIDLHTFLTTLDIPSNGNPDILLDDSNLVTDGASGAGTRLENGDSFVPTNEFKANQITSAVYVSEEFRPISKLKTILGLRIEQFRSLYTGFDVSGIIFEEDREVINKLDFFPSANLIYEYNDKFNIRSSYSRTTARPSFKEATSAAIQDPITDRIFNGNLELNPTYIDNIDLRFEYYGDKGAFFAASGFYKNFTDPIELTFFRSAPTQLQPKNLGDANVYGIELEARYPLSFIVDGLSINTNFSLIESELQMSDIEYQSRYGLLQVGQTVTQAMIDSGLDTGGAALGETSKDTRALQGQTPYTFNLGLSYNNKDKNFNTALNYNVQGETLQVVGTGPLPDIYTQPFNSLNLTASKSLGNENKHKINFKVINVLDDKRESLVKAFNQRSQVYSSRAPGRQISLSYSYDF